MKYSPCLTTKCFFTQADNGLECHHIFGGPNRKKSEKYGMKVMLHHSMHRGTPHGVHTNRHNDLIVKMYGQRKFEELYPDLDFIEIFGRNYL